MKNKERVLKLILSAGIIALADNLIKGNIERNLAIGEKYELLDYGIAIHRHHNKGLPMNLADSHQKEVAALSAMALTGELFYAASEVQSGGSRRARFAHGLILGGALSNTYDRVKKGYVVDYISFKNGKAIYNISDFCILTGACLVILDELVGK